ncbi:MAG: class I SAM-dependent methyltransferase [Patescibacteria group bacterium]
MTPLIFLALIIIVAVSALWASFSAAPWLPTRAKDIDRLLELAKLSPGSLVYDLGCGDARLLMRAARKYGAHGVGFEISILPFLWSWVRVALSKERGRITIKYRNFYQVDLAAADAVVCFLTPPAMIKLEPKLRQELRSGSCFVTYCFKLPTWQPTTVSRPDKKDIPIYVYTKN